jgi:hypothetical protein
VFLLRERRRDLLAGAAVVAREIRWNARVAARAEGAQAGVKATAAELRFDAWETHKAKLHAFTVSRDPDLWDDVADAYDDLAVTKARGHRPPRSRRLIQLSERLDRATF